MGARVQSDQNWCASGTAKYFFSNKGLNCWNMLHQQKVDAPLIHVFESRLSRIGDNQMDFMDWSSEPQASLVRWSAGKATQGKSQGKSTLVKTF